jgi:Bacterial archaeo-eukaryotic release factor family 3
MNRLVTPEKHKKMDPAHYWPAISIIMPFEPKMSLKTDLVHSLEIAADKAGQQLSENYSDEMSTLVMQKLKAIIRDLNFNTHKTSIAIYVSPVFEKILYLDGAVEERIVVDDSFDIRDLVYTKKQLHKYLVIVLSGTESQVYFGNSSSLIRIVSNASPFEDTYVNDVAGGAANSLDLPGQKETGVDHFLHLIDNSLDIILHAYHLPLFVLAPEKILCLFKDLTRHRGSVIEYVSGNYEAATLIQLSEKLEPYIADWKKVKQKDLLNQLEEAAGKKKLAVGMKDVWREAMCRKGRLLVVEENYMYATKSGDSEQLIGEAFKPFNRFSYIKDVVDEVIEKVFENGGDVEFVDDNLLKDYHRIALIQPY